MFKWRTEPVETIDYKKLYFETVEQLKEVSRECGSLRNELEAIKPVVEKGELKPAVSTHCRECVYCVHSDWDGRVIGCCKDVVCEDFKAIDND